MSEGVVTSVGAITYTFESFDAATSVIILKAGATVSATVKRVMRGHEPTANFEGGNHTIRLVAPEFNELSTYAANAPVELSGVIETPTYWTCVHI